MTFQTTVRDPGIDDHCRMRHGPRPGCELEEFSPSPNPGLSHTGEVTS